MASMAFYWYCEDVSSVYCIKHAFFMSQEKTLKLFENAEGLPEGWKVASVSCELWRKDYTH